MRAWSHLTRAFGAAVVVAWSLMSAGLATAQLNQPLHRDGWILAAAHAPGDQGAIWRTDLWAVADEANATITLEFCRMEEDGRLATTRVLSLSGGDRVTYVEDVVSHFLDVGAAGWVGAIHYTSAANVQLWARVYSISPDGTESYGQIVAGQATANASETYDPEDVRDFQWMYALRHTADGRYRVNVGVVNPNPVEHDYWVVIYRTDGNRNRVETVTVPPMSMIQLSDPFEDFDGGEWSDYKIRVQAATEGGTEFAYASVVDNATNDAFFVRGVRNYLNDFLSAENCVMHDDGWILAAAHAGGSEGSIWRTDLWFAAPQNTWHASVELSFHRLGEDGSQAQKFVIDLTDGPETYYFEDVVDHFLGVGDDDWVGAIHYTTDNTTIQAWARVYSVNETGTASYGQLIEGIPTDDRSPDEASCDFDEHQHLVATKHTADGRFRVNIGVVNPGPTRAEYDIVALGSDLQCPAGSGCGNRHLSVPPMSMMQLRDPFSGWQGGEWSAADIVVKCTTEGGHGFAYASVVDNATNDAYFVRGIKLLTQDGS